MDTPELCYYSGAGLTNGVFARVADGDRRLNQYEVQVMRASRGQPQEDREPVPDAGASELHTDLTNALLDEARIDGALPLPETSAPGFGPIRTRFP